MAVGSQYQLTASGGPRADTDVQFTSSESGMAEVSAAGLVTARRPGSVRLTGRVADRDPTTGQNVVYSEVRHTLGAGDKISIAGAVAEVLL